VHMATVHLVIIFCYSQSIYFAMLSGLPLEHSIYPTAVVNSTAVCSS
jgi:hypothetical protein